MRGSRYARLTRGRANGTSAPMTRTSARARRPVRTSAIDFASRYAPRASVATMRPLLKWAAATCPHASAIPPSHRSRGGQLSALTYREAAASSTALHARVPENGSSSTKCESAIRRPSARPPAVEEGLDTRSVRRKA
jgi:hypothetical protein